MKDIFTRIRTSIRSCQSKIVDYIKMVKNYLQSLSNDHHKLKKKELNHKDTIKEDKDGVKKLPKINGNYPDDFILEEVLDSLKTQMKLFWNHNEFYYITSIIKKDLILASHFDLIQGFFKTLKRLEDFRFINGINETDIEKQKIRDIIDFLFQKLKVDITSFWNEQYEIYIYLGNKKLTKQLEEHRDFILQEHWRMIVEGVIDLWMKLDKKKKK